MTTKTEVKPPDRIWLLKAVMAAEGVEQFDVPLALRPHSVEYVRADFLLDSLSTAREEAEQLRVENQRLTREIASMAQGVVAMADATRKDRARDKEKG